MTELDSRTTLIRADSGPSESGRRTSSWSLPPDLLAEAVGRLRSSALLYAVAYFLAAFVPGLVDPQKRVLLAGNPGQWIPRVLSIGLALALAWLAGRGEIPSRLKLYAALGFEVLGSLGIAVVEYQHITAPIRQGGAGPGGFGLSWVAAFVLVFSVVVPMPPGITVLSRAGDPGRARIHRAGLSRQGPERPPADCRQLATRLATVPLAREWTDGRARQWWDQHRPSGDTVARVLEEAVR